VQEVKKKKICKRKHQYVSCNFDKLNFQIIYTLKTSVGMIFLNEKEPTGMEE